MLFDGFFNILTKEYQKHYTKIINKQKLQIKLAKTLKFVNKNF